MRKRATWSILIAAALALTSCSSASTPSAAPTTTGAATTAAPATTSTDTTTAPAPTASSETTTAPAAEASGKLTVWVDAVRQPVAKAYAAAHPKVQLDIVTFDGDGNGATGLQAKIQLWNRTNNGWPDVIFSEQVNDPVWMAKKPFEFAAPLKGLLSDDILKDWPAPSTAQCTVDGVQVCVQDNLAPVVLWENKTLMDKFGYTTPKTWQEWAALGAKVATEHPGYIIGNMGDSYSHWIYLWGNQCPLSGVDGTTVTINEGDKHCTEMAALLDPLIKNKTVPPLGIFSPDFAKAYGGADSKVLLMPGPAWYAQDILGGVLHTAAGQITAAPPLKWEGESATTTGQVGGGPWIISKHSGNIAAAADFVTWATTVFNPDPTTKDARAGLPAYKPLAVKWLAGMAQNKFFAADPTPALNEAAGEIWTGWNLVTYPDQPVWSNTVVTKLVSGQSLSSMLKPLGDTLAQTAQAAGYQVKRG